MAENPIERRLWWEEADKRSFRKATEVEIDEALKLEKRISELTHRIAEAEKELANIRASTGNKVFYDEPGHPYDVRTFIASGRCELL